MRAVILRVTGALLRALLVAMALAMPPVLLPAIGAEAAQLSVLVALLAGAYVFAEYAARFPTLIDFRFAPPANRLRYVAGVGVIVMVAIALGGPAFNSTVFDGLLRALARILVELSDIPGSPVRLLVLALPADMPPDVAEALRRAAGTAYPMALVGVAGFAVVVRVGHWPDRPEGFNLWVNLPLFDPGSRPDAPARLRRRATVNLVLGFVLPFLGAALAKFALAGGGHGWLADPQTQLWGMVAWAFVPANLAMRGIALQKVATLVEADARRRARGAAGTAGDGLQPAE